MHYFKSKWFTIPWWSLRKSSYLIWIMILGAILLIVLISIFYIRSLPALDIWHTTVLKNEFHLNSNVKDFKAYMALEDRLFAELDEEIVKKLPISKQSKINRYTKNSLSNPERWNQNWNRSYEKALDDPKMGVLLVHGMSDSPYSLHTQAEYLHDKGAYVVGIRLPGHGTLPSGLLDATWEEMAEVLKMGMLYLKQKVGNKPLQIIGYSTGAPLALHYTFSALEDPALTVPSSLVFYSPAIAVSRAAKFAVFQKWAAALLASDKLEWNSVLPEYDPYKYGSFSINAADQVYRLCNTVEREFEDYKKSQTKEFPPVLTFASIVDATVLIPNIISGLYDRLPKGDHHFVLFDINNKFSHNFLINQHTTKLISTLRNTVPNENYTFELITDLNSSNGKVQLIRDHRQILDLNMTWPQGIYSLSHVALPFSKYDPLYGDSDAPKSPGIQLGHSAGYGEKMVLQISPSVLLRQRWNPFQAYSQQRILQFMKLK